MLMVAMNALPPVPGVFGEGWREEWLRRLEATEPWELGWLEHQDEDDFWRHGSVWFDGYEAIEAATMIIAGHADGYRNMALRGYERLRGPKAVLFGPWSHMAARSSMPGPRIDHVPEMIRWWRRWLAEEDTGVDRDPPIRIFVRHPSEPRADLDSFEGEWRCEPVWPPARLREEPRGLAGATSSNGATLQIRGDVGVSGSIWCAADLPFGIPWDQRTDEGMSLVFDWPVQEEPVEIMGHPRLELTVTSSVPVAFVSAKLCCVHPDGASELVTRGILNLTHRDVPRGADRTRARRTGARDARAGRDRVRVAGGDACAARPGRQRLPVVVAASGGWHARRRRRAVDPGPAGARRAARGTAAHVRSR